MIECDINDAQSIIAEIAESESITAEIAESESITSEIDVGGVVQLLPEDIGIYDGETTVEPKATSETVLETAQKIVQDDITVLRVPFYQVSNPQGGNTVYIAYDTEVQ